MGAELEQDLRHLKENYVNLFLPNRPVLKKRKILCACEYIDISRKITRTTTIKKISEYLERY